MPTRRMPTVSVFGQCYRNATIGISRTVATTPVVTTTGPSSHPNWYKSPPLSQEHSRSLEAIALHRQEQGDEIMRAIAQRFGTDTLLTRIREMHTCMEMAVRVAECGTAAERRHDAEAIVRLLMGNEIAVVALQLNEPGLSRIPLPPNLAAPLTFVAARLLIDEVAGGSGHLMAKLEVNKMETRLISFVKRGGVKPWPHSCEFIIGPYASAAQFAQVQVRYAASHLGRSAPVMDPDPDGFAGA